MSDQTTSSVEQKPIEEQIKIENTVGSTETNELKEPENYQEVNWRKFREERALERKKLEEEKRQREEANKLAKAKAEEAAALKAAMDALLNKQETQYEEEDSDEKRIERLVEQKLQERYRREAEERARKEHEELPQTLTKTFNDFNQVCSAENLDYLSFHYPEVAHAYKHMPDSFDKWANIYKAVKRFVPNTDSRRDMAKAEKNFNKPQSPSSPGMTNQGTGGMSPKLDEKRKAENWERMQRVLRGVS